MSDTMTTELQIFGPRNQETALDMLTEGLGTDDGKPFSLVNFLNFLAGVSDLPTHPDPLEFYGVDGEPQFAEGADWEKATSENADEVVRSLRFHTDRVAPEMIFSLKMLGGCLAGSRIVLFQTVGDSDGMSFLYASIIDGEVDRGGIFDGETLESIPAKWATNLTESDKRDVLERFWSGSQQIS